MSTTADAVSGSCVLPDDARGVLGFAREQRAVADRAEVRLLEAAVQWAVIHPTEWVEDSERYRLRSGGEAPVGLAGPGAPLVAEFSVAEFGAAIGMTPEAGKYYLGHALELRYRLPRLWEQVLTGTVQAWRARRVADATIGRQLSIEAAAFVDAHAAAVAGKVRASQLDRLVDEAVARFMPETAEQERRDAEDRRRFDINTGQPSFHGTAHLEGELDLIDAIALEEAIREIADELKDLGCGESLDVRRSIAAGELARRQTTLDYQSQDASAGFEARAADGPRTSTAGQEGGEGSVGFEARSARTSTAGHGEGPGTSTAGHGDGARTSTAGQEGGEGSAGFEARAADGPRTSSTGHGDGARTSTTGGRRRRQRIVLQVAVTDAAIRGESGHTVGRCATTKAPVTVDTIRDWCGHPDAQIIVKPVIDLDDHVHVDAYEVPDRIRERVALRDHHCVFPWCTRPARACDCDHVTPWREDGGPEQTCACRLAPLCRSHHRLKTHAAWSCAVIEPGTYLWTSPHGYQFLRDHTGTRDITPATAGRRREPPRP